MSGEITLDDIITALRDYDKTIAVKAQYEKPVAIKFGAKIDYEKATPIKRVWITGPLAASVFRNFRDDCLRPILKFRNKLEKLKESSPWGCGYVLKEILVELNDAISKTQRVTGVKVEVVK